MIEPKKTGKSGTKAKKKLQVSKETLKDLSARAADRVKGGIPPKIDTDCYATSGRC